MGLVFFGDLKYKMYNVVGVYIFDDVDGEVVCEVLLLCFNIEIGISFGLFKGKIWCIGIMGYNVWEDVVFYIL